MSFCEELKANNIDPDKFISLQHEFIAHCRKHQETNADTISYRDYLERDQTLSMIEKFINRLEREQLQQKIKQVTTTPSIL